MSKKSLSQIDVVILCGGLGQRLRSRIGDQQKTLVRIQDKPFLDYIFSYLALFGFHRSIRPHLFSDQ